MGTSVPNRNRQNLFQSRQECRLYAEANGSGLPRDSFDQAIALQGFDHIVNRGRGNPEVALQVRLRGRPAMDLGVVVDEGQILTLFNGVCVCFGRFVASRFQGRTE